MGALQNLLDEARNTQQFPRRIEVTPTTDPSSSVPWYRFNTGYADHLLSVMEATAEVLNAYFQATESERTLFVFSSWRGWWTSVRLMVSLQNVLYVLRKY